MLRAALHRQPPPAPCSPARPPAHPAGLGSVIIDSQPLTVAVLAALLFGESLSAVGVLGLFLGVLGLGLLEVPQELLLQGPGAIAASAAASGSVLQSGEFYMLLAAQSMALGTVMVRWGGPAAAYRLPLGSSLSAAGFA